MIKVLSIACDNASPNDIMINELAELFTCFPGSMNRVCCFLHIINLIVWRILKQFDLPKKKSHDYDADLDRLTDDIEKEELETRKELDGGEDDDDDEVFEVLGDARMSEDVQIVRKVLVKVSPQPC